MSKTSVQPGNGVFVAYTDVTYDKLRASISPLATITYGADYPNIQSGDLSTPGFEMHIGAADGLSPLGSSERLLWTIPAPAIALGTETFTPSAPADQTTYGLALYNGINITPPSSTAFLPASINVVPEPSSIVLFGLGACGLFAVVRRRTPRQARGRHATE